MTLIDPRRSIRSVLEALSEESGVTIDAEVVLATLGPPLEEALGPWFDGEALEHACRRFREIQGPCWSSRPIRCPARSRLSAPSVDGAARRSSSRPSTNLTRGTSLQAVGIDADAVVGWRYGPQKGDALRDHGAQVYVGDHPADVLAAKVGGSVSVAVATGGTTEPALRRVGADVVLPNLLAFPSWLEGWMATGSRFDGHLTPDCRPDAAKEPTPKGARGVDSFTSPRWDEDKERTSSYLWATGQVGRNGRNAHRVIASDTPSCRTRSRILPTFRSFPRCCRSVESYGGEVNSRGPRDDGCINDERVGSVRRSESDKSPPLGNPHRLMRSLAFAIPLIRDWVSSH